MPTPAIPLTPHIPDRPAWLCRQCRTPWPCVAARSDLRDEFGEVGLLAYYLAAQMMEYAADRGGRPAADVYDRFIGWVRPVASA